MTLLGLFVVLIIGIIVGGLILMYLESCPHTWVKISEVQKKNEKYKIYETVETYQCTHCKETKTIKY